MKFGKSPVSWKSKKQGVVSKSSEYRAMSAAASEITWLGRLLKELEVTDLQPLVLHCDNQSAIHIAKNPVQHKRKNILKLIFTSLETKWRD